MALPIHFFKMCHLATIAVGCIVQPQQTTYSEKPNCWNFCIWNNHGQHGHMTMAIPDVAFLAVQFCSYTIHHMLYEMPS